MSSFIYPNYLIGGSGEKGPTGPTGPTGPVGPTGAAGINIFGTTGSGIISITAITGNYQGFKFITTFNDGRTFESSNFIGLTGFWFVQTEATCSGCPLDIISVGKTGTNDWKFSENYDYNPLSTRSSNIILKTLKTRTPDLIDIEPTEDFKNIKISYNNVFSGLTLSGATYPSLVIGSGITVFGATGSSYNISENSLNLVIRQYLEGITHLVGDTSDNIDSYYTVDTKNNSIFQIIKSSFNSMKINIRRDNTIGSDESKSMLLIVPLETELTGPFQIEGEDVEIYFPLGIIPKPKTGINVYSAISYGKDWYMNCVGLGITKDDWSKQKLRLDDTYLSSESLLTSLLASWQGDLSYDFNNDEVVNATDLTQLLSNWSSGVFNSYYKDCAVINGTSYDRECIGQVPTNTNLPTLQSINPNSGPIGTAVNITGTEFTNVQALKIGNNNADPVVITSTLIQTKIPSGSGSNQVTITTSSGTVSGLNYTYTQPPPEDPVPQIISVSPMNGHRNGGDQIIISGTNLNYINQILIQGNTTTITNQSPSSITLTTPSGNPGPATFKIIRSNGEFFNYTGWEYRQPIPPYISDITPNNGSSQGGTNIRITGYNFIDVVSIKIGDNHCINWDILEDELITTTTPAGPPGDNVLRIETRQEGSVTGTFTYSGTQPPSPIISDITPTSGQAGTTVYIRGNYLYRSPGSEGPEDPEITIDGNICTILSIEDTEITITIPENNAPGPKNLLFIANNGTVEISNAFTYIVPTPVLTNITSTNADGSDKSYLLTTKEQPQQTIKITGNNLSEVDRVFIYEPDNTYNVIDVTTTNSNLIEFDLSDTFVERNRFVKFVAITRNNIPSNELVNIEWRVKPYLEKVLLKTNPNAISPYPVLIDDANLPTVQVYGKYLDAKNNGSSFNVSKVSGVDCGSVGWVEWNGTYYEIKLPNIATTGYKSFERLRSLDDSNITSMTAKLSDQFIYYHGGPVINTVTPNSGVNTTSHVVTINGSNLWYSNETTEVFVNNILMALIFKSSTELQFIIPASPTTSGWVPIKIQRYHGPWPTNTTPVGLLTTTILEGFHFDVPPSGVICSGVLNHQVPVTSQGTVVNFATGVVLNGVASGVPGWDINPYGTSDTNVALLAGSGTGIMRNPNAGTFTFRTYLPVDTEVGPTAYFYGNSAAAMGTAVGQWAPNSEGYIGVKFFNEASSPPTIHYGFIQMRIGATATDRTIIGFCWNQTPNQSIITSPIT